MKRMVLAGVAPVLLCGCGPNAREPDRLAPVRVLGVDGSSPVELTGVCGAVGGGEPLRGSCRGEDFRQARERLPWSGREELTLTGVGWILLGRGADGASVLFGVMEDRELSPSAAVWLAEESAAAVLSRCADPAAELELLGLQGSAGTAAAKALGTLLTEGAVCLPLLGEREGRLCVVGEEWLR